ncbi:MAG: Shikimate kinase 2 [Chlamydiia bacterium]|nr:Shikimate kinase 2 [Chlamydiia bacterium]MCH9618070.1 Shikimate kinase 2 [Chlamydiia bacterium]MCH9624210.1 Shikimate kinase 2 [Chlamydiia bacterium]
MSNIVLIGFQGVGKTFFGKRLAKHLRWDFIDTDKLLCAEFGGGMTKKEIFVSIGEREFRKREKAILKSLIGNERCVIAAGGGVVEVKGVRSILWQLGKVIYLKKDLACLEEAHEGGERMYLRGQSVEEVYQRRSALYQEICTETVEAEWDQILLADSLK